MHVAVIGSGIAGLGAAWLLAKSHRVTLIEAEPRTGGHSNTVEIESGGRQCPIDTGFIVYNTACYPNLIALFDHLGVETTPTNMSFAVSLHGGRYEYSGSGATGVFAQPANLLSLGHWRMLWDILRFFREVGAIDAAGTAPTVPLGVWLRQRGYSRAFIDRHIAPMAAAIWSTPAGEVLDFPLAAFARFFSNHGLLQVSGRPQWRTVVGGSRRYVDKVLASFGGEVMVGDGVSQVQRGETGVDVTLASGAVRRFDHVVLACHGDQALALLADPSDREREVLGAFRYSDNRAILHRDAMQMPKRRRAWSSWNFIDDATAPRGLRQQAAQVSVTYWMNRLQPLATDVDHFVTLNPVRPIDPDLVLREFAYTHPIFDAAAISAQSRLWGLQGHRKTWFCGSYFGFGFHEDALQAGLAVAEDLSGMARPWVVANASGRIQRTPVDRAVAPAPAMVSE